jgi:hypothetical protein
MTDELVRFFAEKKAIPLCQQWDGIDIDVDDLKDVVRKRWHDNDPWVEPAGLNRPIDELEWYDSLARYLAAQAFLGKTKHADSIAGTFIELFEDIRPTLQDHGDVWLCDILALTRYRGKLCERAFGLIESALKSSSTGVPQQDAESFAFFANVWRTVAQKVIVEATERDLQNQSFLSGLSDIPFGVNNLLRDWFPSKLTRRRAEESRVYWYEGVCGDFFDSMRVLYEDPVARRISHCTEPDWAPSYDTSIALFAGGLKSERLSESEALINAILKSATDDNPISLRGWMPEVGRLRTALLRYWQKQYAEEIRSQRVIGQVDVAIYADEVLSAIEAMGVAAE